MKFLVLVVICSVVLSFAMGGRPGTKEGGMSFNYNYEVKDFHSGNKFSHNTDSDGDVTKGEYRVLLPDGRTQIVSYLASKNGYQPDVKYE